MPETIQSVQPGSSIDGLISVFVAAIQLILQHVKPYRLPNTNPSSLGR